MLYVPWPKTPLGLSEAEAHAFTLVEWRRRLLWGEHMRRRCQQWADQVAMRLTRCGQRDARW